MHAKVSHAILSILVTCLLFSLLTFITKAQEYPFCNNTGQSYTQGSQYEFNLNVTLSTLASNITSNGFYNITIGSSPDRVSGRLQCESYASYKDCRLCAKTLVSDIIKLCPNRREAVISNKLCRLRYADYRFFSIATTDPALCASNYDFETSNPVFFSRLSGKLINYLSSLAASDASKYSTGRTSFNDSVYIYGLARCTRDLSTKTCLTCLQNMIQRVTKCADKKIGGRALSVSCQVRYETYPFYPSFQSPSLALPGSSTTRTNNRSSDPHGETAFNDSVTIYGMVQCTRDLSPDNCSRCLKVAVADLSRCCKGRGGGRVRSKSCDFRYEIYIFDIVFNISLLLSPPVLDSPTTSVSPPVDSRTTKPEMTNKKKKNVILIVIIVVASVLMLVITIFFLWRKVMKKRVEVFKECNSAESEFTSTESLIFDLATLRVATNHFSDSHKLGEGGFGSVYMGEIPDGRKIAVKRLARHSGQGFEQLKTEVTLVAKLMHKNLVQLLGFCIREEEKLLIYEFLPNGSLDQILYDESKRPLLNWEKRYKIILGIASGVLYLHQDSHDKIVHRDLKASNILLDEDMTAKISDFGLARLFGKSQVEDNTNHIAGTYGYMAPEYTTHGKYSTKSDVFSFGVLVLEIVSGRKSSGFHNSMNLLNYVWHYWNGGMALDIVDPTLGNQWLPSKILKCLQLGLLCVQQEPHRRPNMMAQQLYCNMSSSFST